MHRVALLAAVFGATCAPGLEHARDTLALDDAASETAQFYNTL